MEKQVQVQRTFEISGTFTDRTGERKYTKEVHARNENLAKEKVLSEFGSKHKLRRNAVKIASVKEKK